MGIFIYINYLTLNQQGFLDERSQDEQCVPRCYTVTVTQACK